MPAKRPSRQSSRTRRVSSRRQPAPDQPKPKKTGERPVGEAVRDELPPRLEPITEKLD
jgi:hypothetical protein